jgi:hypothetical protein
MKKTVILLFTISFLAALVTVYLMWNKPHSDMNIQEADVEITAEALFTAYESDEQGADKQYLGKILAVSGIVEQVQAGETNTIILSSGSGLFGVRCELDPHNETAIPDYKPGDSITLKGTCSGYLGDVVLSRAVPVR